MKMTLVDREVLVSLPKGKWFDKYDMPFLKNAEFRFDRLLAQNRLLYRSEDGVSQYRVIDGSEEDV